MKAWQSFLFGAIGFCLGSIVTAFYLSYRQTVDGYKLPDLREGLIKKWNSAANSIEEIIGKRTRGTIIWQWPSKPIKKRRAKEEHSVILKYHMEHPEATYEQLADQFNCGRKTIERAIKDGRLGKI